MSHLDSAINLVDCPKVQSVYYTIQGGFLLQHQHHSRAIDAFKTAVETLDKNYVAWNHLGLAYFDLGEFENAANSFGASIAIRPDFNAFTLLAKSQLHFDAAAAVQSAESALRLKPDWDEAMEVCDAAKNERRA